MLAFVIKPSCQVHVRVLLAILNYLLCLKPRKYGVQKCGRIVRVSLDL